MKRHIGNSRIEKEKEIVTLMIKLYCRKIEKNDELCESCRELIEYAYHRLDRCKYGNEKLPCKKCPTHCYKPAMRLKMKKIMRTIGPRMIFYAPLETLRHFLK